MGISKNKPKKTASKNRDLKEARKITGQPESLKISDFPELLKIRHQAIIELLSEDISSVPVMATVLTQILEKYGYRRWVNDAMVATGSADQVDMSDGKKRDNSKATEEDLENLQVGRYSPSDRKAIFILSRCWESSDGEDSGGKDSGEEELGRKDSAEESSLGQDKLDKLDHLGKEGILPDLIECHIRPHKGKGHLPDDLKSPPNPKSAAILEILPAKLRAYSRTYKEDELLVIVVCDSDLEKPEALRLALETCLESELKNVSSIGISTEEMEAWILGDRKALLAAYPDMDQEAYTQYRQDSICGTWEHLARFIMKERAETLMGMPYPVIGLYKSRWAEKVAPFMRNDQNASPSFQAFVLSVEEGLEQLAYKLAQKRLATTEQAQPQLSKKQPTKA